MKHLAHVISVEAASEVLKAWQLPSFVLPTLLFPTGFYVLFGLMVPAPGDRGSTAALTLANYGVFAAMGPSLFGFGVGVASERTQGELELKRVSPVPVWVFLAGKLYMALTATLVVLILLYGLAASGGGVALSRLCWLRLAGVHLMTVPPMALLGLTLGLVFRPQAAAGLANVLLLSMAALGGLFLPVSLLPSVVGQLSQTLPTYHLSQLALSSMGAKEPSLWTTHIVAWTGHTTLLGLVAVWAWRRFAGDARR
ncbi:MAG: ABC transporter permease [Myxococcota bacterium]